MLEQIVCGVTEPASERLGCRASSRASLPGVASPGADHALALERQMARLLQFPSDLFFMSFVVLLLEIRKYKSETLSSLIKLEVNA